MRRCPQCRRECLDMYEVCDCGYTFPEEDWAGPQESSPALSAGATVLRRPGRISKAFFLGSVAVSMGCAIALMVPASIRARSGDPEAAFPLLLLADVPAIYGGIVLFVLFHRMWAAIQDGYARTTPGRAVGFLFIPFYNLYWAFQVLWGFSQDYNQYLQRHDISAEPLPGGLFLAYTILCFTTWIPVLGLVLMAVNYFVGLAMVSKICDAVNAIAAPSGASA